jgi:hypothetical protein
MESFGQYLYSLPALLGDAVTNFQGRYRKSVPLTKNGYKVTPSKGKSTSTPASIKLPALGGQAEFTLK